MRDSVSDLKGLSCSFGGTVIRSMFELGCGETKNVDPRQTEQKKERKRKYVVYKQYKGNCPTGDEPLTQKKTQKGREEKERD